MPYFVRLPSRPDVTDQVAAREHYLNIINGDATIIQRELRRRGYAGYEPRTAATLCALFEMAHARRPKPGRFAFFDVGANGGLYSFLCKALYRNDADVAAFEPAPETHKWLSAISEANALDIHAERLAVSDREQDLVLYLSEKSDASNSLNPGFKDRHKGQVTVQCIALDTYCARTGLYPDVLKIDTETHEAQVLRGATELLSSRHPYLVVEAIKKRGVDYGRSISDVLSEIGGYHFYRISEASEFEERDHIFAEEKSDYRDWLVSPIPLAPAFGDDVARWQARLAGCRAEDNVK